MSAQLKEKSTSKNLVANSFTTRVRVWVSGGTVFCVHKDILSRASPVFNLMLHYSEQERSDFQTIKLDMNANIFKIILHFIHTGSMPSDNTLSLELALGVLRSSSEYSMDSITKAAIGSIQKMVTPDNAILILQTAREVESCELEEVALDIIYRNAAEILNSKDFISMGSFDICRIIASDRLSCDELTVFHAALRWAQHKATASGTCGSRVKYYFSQVVKHIRFPLLTVAEFATISDVITEHSLIDPKQLADISDFISFSQPAAIPEWYTFCKKPRAYNRK